MSWDDLALVVLGLTGVLTLLLSQVRDVLAKTAEVIQAWHDMRRILRERRREHGQEDPAPD